MIFENNDTIVFAGDSITDMGKIKPYGEDGSVRGSERDMSICFPI